MKVEYTLTVPRSAVVDDVDLVNGNLMVVGVQGGVEAEAVNGNIVVREGAGYASLSTVNGGIELYVNQLDSAEQVELETVNGTIDLYLASSVGADVRAESVNGKLANDLVQSFHRADLENTLSMFQWANFVYNYAPYPCRFPEGMKKWAETGGLNGINHNAEEVKDGSHE